MKRLLACAALLSTCSGYAQDIPPSDFAAGALATVVETEPWLETNSIAPEGIIAPLMPCYFTDDGCQRDGFLNVFVSMGSVCYAVENGCALAEEHERKAYLNALLESNPPMTDEQHAQNVREAHVALWRAHDAYIAAEKLVNEVNDWARAAGLTVGHDEEKCGKNRSNFNESWLPLEVENMRCLAIYRLTRTDVETRVTE